MGKAKKTIGIILLGFAILVAGLVYVVTWTGSTKDIVAVADQFKPDESWKFTSEVITPPRTICIDILCPEVRKEWEVDQRLDTKQEFETIAKIGQTVLTVEDDCLSESQIRESREICTAEGNVGNYRAKIEYRGVNTGGNKLQILLTVVEQKDAN